MKLFLTFVFCLLGLFSPVFAQNDTFPEIEATMDMEDISYPEMSEMDSIELARMIDSLMKEFGGLPPEGTSLLIDPKPFERKGVFASVNYDAYYRYAPNETHSLYSQSLAHNAVRSGWVNLKLGANYEYWAISTDWVAGQRAKEWYGDRKGVFKYLEEGYVSLKPATDFKISMGMFNYLTNYEWNEPCDNPNYSNSYANSLIPVSQTGIQFEFPLYKKWSGMVGLVGNGDVVNPVTPLNSLPENQMAQLFYEGKKIELTFNTVWEHDIKRDFSIAPNSTYLVLENLGDWQIKDAFKLGWDVSYYDTFEDDATAITSVCLYPQYELSKSMNLNLRSEYIMFPEDAILKETPYIFSNTLTFKYNFGEFIYLMPEIRYDFSNVDYFNKRGATGGTITNVPNELQFSLGLNIELGKSNPQ